MPRQKQEKDAAGQQQDGITGQKEVFRARNAVFHSEKRERPAAQRAFEQFAEGCAVLSVQAENRPGKGGGRQRNRQNTPKEMGKFPLHHAHSRSPNLLKR